MSLRNNNTTVLVSRSETILEKWTCIFVDSNAERISKLCAYCLILLGSFFRKHLNNHYRLQASRFTKNNELFHREHGCLRSAFPTGSNS